MTKINIKNYFIISVLILSASSMVQNHAFASSATIDLGTASPFGILASTYTNTAGGVSITGDVGYTTGPAVAPTISGSTHVGDGAYTQAGIDQGNALAALAALTCDHSFGAAQDLSLLPQPLAPGVYCITGAQSIGTGGITLGAGTYVFRSTGALTTVDHSVVTLSGVADASSVFWTPGGATTLGVNSVFVGTDIDASGIITIGDNVMWLGRALDFAATVSTGPGVQITVPVTVVDTANPVTTITSPADNSFSTSSTVNLSGTSSDTNLVSTEISVDGVFQATSGTATSWTFSATSLSEGSHTFQTLATDSAGNTGLSSIVNVTVDTVAPTGTITSPTNGETLGTSTVPVSGTASDATSGVTSVTISVDSGSFVAVTGTTWTFNTASLSDGSHTLQIKVTDNAGNVFTSGTTTFTVDTANPVATITSPTNGAFVNTTTPTITGTGTDGSSGITSVQIQVDAGSFNTVSTSDSFAHWTFTTSALFQGSHTINAKITDNLSHTTTSSITITVDIINPVTTITSPADNSFSTSSTVNLSGTSSDTNLLSTEISVDGVFQATSGTATSWTFSATSLSEGSHTFQTRATDSAVNTGLSSIIHVTVDTTAPIITLSGSATVNILQGSVYNDAGATANDNIDGVITSSIVTVNPVNTAVLGTYHVTYDVTDHVGIPAIQVVRTVNVVAVIGNAPVITITGNNPEKVLLHGTYTDANATATDVEDGVIAVTTTGNNVDVNTIGTYSVDYSVTDSDGNTVTVFRTVNVYALTFHMSESPTPSLYTPSLGGVQGQTFSDGLKINGQVFDVSKFHTPVPQQVLPLGKPATISIKQGLTRGSPFWQHVMIFMNFGAKDTKTGNADTWISVDKNDGVQVHDPNGFVKNVSANNDFIAYGMTTTFTFTPVKQMSDSNVIVRVWDNQLRQTDAYVDGAIVLGDAPTPPKPMQKPDWIQVFSNLKDADNAVESAGFKKPVLFAHISTTSQVWTQPNTGHVLWVFDTKDAQVALIIYDSNGNMVRENAEQLVKASTTLMGKDTSYAGNHLNRQNVDEMNQAKAQQELNAIQTMKRLGYQP